MQAVREAARHWPAGTVHDEDFGASAHPGPGGDGPFRVRLARSGAVLDVAANETVLQVLRRHGLDVPASCEAGTCGTCRTALLAGIAEHRNFVLAQDEQASAIIVCVSHARGPELTLDA